MSQPVILSPAQQQVVTHRGSDLQVIACAGSGKTESISRRVAALIAEGVPPSAIVAFTFTERAAAELKERITRRVAELMGPAFRDRLSPMFVGTIHAYCFRLLQDHLPEFGNFDVLDEHQHVGFLSREHRRIGLGNLKAKHWEPIRDFMRTVDVIGNEQIPSDALAGTALGDCFAAYQRILAERHCLTFGQLISRALEALERPDILARVHGALQHLFVDEYQDINPSQERLITLLAHPPVRLTVVGDDDQSIYQWRGSDVRNIVTFRQRRAGAAAVELDTNRRSRTDIVETADAFAQAIPGRIPKTMRADRPAAPNGVVPWAAETDRDEAERIADTIPRLVELGYRYRDIAVLYRSVRTSAPPLIAALRARNIPFSAGGRTGLFLQPDVAAIGEVFAWFVGGDWRDDPFGEFRPASLDQAVASLQATFGAERPIPELREYIEDWRAFVLRGHRPVNLVGDYYRLLRTLRAHEIDPDDPAGSARLGGLARFSVVLGDFEHVHRRGRHAEQNGRRIFEAAADRGKDYFRALHNYLLHYARDAYEEFDAEPASDLDAVDVLTIHQAKGLEWPVVFVPALVEGRFPSRRAGQPQKWLLPDAVFPADVRHRYEGGDAEERRLFYVALTRARDAVYLSSFTRKARAFQPSAYLTEIAGTHVPAPAQLPLPPAPARVSSSEPPPLDVSFSDLADFDDCGYRYRLGRSLGFQTQIAPELGYGRAVHHVLRLIAEAAGTHGRIPTPDEARALVEREFFVPFASDQAADAMRRSALRLVRAYLERHPGDLDRIWAQERPFALHLYGGTVSGRADVILDREGGREGSLAVVDYKVATDDARARRYEEQLRVYAAAAAGEGLTVDAAYLHELRDGSRRAVDIGPEALEAARSAVAQRLADLRSARFEPKAETARCAACEHQEICRFRPDSANS